MRMHMVGVAMGRNNHFVTGDRFRKLACNLVGNLRCDVFFRRKRLHHVIKHSAAVLVVHSFCVHEFIEGKRRYTVDAGNQVLTIVICFRVLAGVGDQAEQTLNAL